MKANYIYLNEKHWLQVIAETEKKRWKKGPFSFYTTASCKLIVTHLHSLEETASKDAENMKKKKLQQSTNFYTRVCVHCSFILNVSHENKLTLEQHPPFGMVFRSEEKRKCKKPGKEF